MSLLEGNTFRGPGQRVPDPLPSSRCSSSTPCASSSFAGMVGGCRIPVPILLHLSPEEPLPACLPPSLGDLLNSQDLPLRLAWVLFLFSSLSPPFFCSPSEPTLPHAALQDGWGGSFPACTSHSSWGHVSCLQSHSSYTYLLCAGSKNRTSRQAASVGAGKINRVIKKADLVCNWFTYHVSLKSKRLWAAQRHGCLEGWMSSRDRPVFSFLLPELFLSLTKLCILFHLFTLLFLLVCRKSRKASGGWVL